MWQAMRARALRSWPAGQDLLAPWGMSRRQHDARNIKDAAHSHGHATGATVSDGWASAAPPLATAGEDTIASVVTGPGTQGAVAIVRLSGAQALPIGLRIFQRAGAGGSSSSSGGNGGGSDGCGSDESHGLGNGDGGEGSSSSSSGGGSSSSRNGRRGSSEDRSGDGASSSGRGGGGAWAPRSHRVYYGAAVDAAGRRIDEVLFIPMRAPRSYTQEDVVEIHTHGGGLCARRVAEAAFAAGARPARPGEFTLRAFLNGRLDLAQAEAVAQLVGARTPAAADSALAGLSGGVGGAVEALRAGVLELLADVEARIDFEEDVGPIDEADVAMRLSKLQAGIEDALRTARAGSLLRQGLQVAIVGRPNVGKSSLLNAWSRSDRAIVTDVPGTTRDVLEAVLVAGGVPLTLLDTAGIRSSPGDAIEALGVERSRAAAEAADLVVFVVDASTGWTQADSEIFTALWGDGPGSRSCRVRGPALLVANKSDAAGERKDLSLPLLAKEAFRALVPTSALLGQGLGELEAAVLALAGAPELAGGGASWAVNERQGEALVRAHEALMRTAQSVGGALPLDCWTVDLRCALLALGEVTGAEASEEVLDSVFSRFCIGK